MIYLFWNNAYILYFLLLHYYLDYNQQFSLSSSQFLMIMPNFYITNNKASYTYISKINRCIKLENIIKMSELKFWVHLSPNRLPTKYHARKKVIDRRSRWNSLSLVFLCLVSLSWSFCVWFFATSWKSSFLKN